MNPGIERSSAHASLPVASCCDGQDWCAVLCTAERLSRKWQSVIVHRLLEEGPLGFTGLQKRVTGISGKVLTQTLEALEADGLIRRDVISKAPLRVQYHLTDAGRDLGPVIEAMQAWGRRHLPKTR